MRSWILIRRIDKKWLLTWALIVLLIYVIISEDDPGDGDEVKKKNIVQKTANLSAAQNAPPPQQADPPPPPVPAGRPVKPEPEPIDVRHVRKPNSSETALDWSAADSIRPTFGRSASTVNETEDLLISDLLSTNPKCRRPLRRLWTKNEKTYGDDKYYPNCKQIIRTAMAGSDTAHRRSFESAKRWRVRDPYNSSTISEMLLSDCETFRSLVDFPSEPASKEEAEYPLAYVFVPYRNLDQTVRLFRMLYQPQNAYCITYDTKSQEVYKKAILRMASCFLGNVYVNPDPEPIFYSTFTLLHSVMECMDLLRKSPIKWRYVQIVSWNDFPLKSNWEMVRIFKTLNGSQDCELMDNNFPHFVTTRHTNVPFSYGTDRRAVPPGGITFYKGSYSTTMSREFVKFMFTNKLSKRLYHYFNGTQFPDEFYWTTLIHNIQLKPPGGFPGQCLVFYSEAAEKKPFISRFQVWLWDKGDRKCAGRLERGSCVYGIGDLKMLIARPELFAHKLYDEYQPSLLYCLEEWYYNLVCAQKKTGLDMEYYKNLPSVIYHNLSPKKKEEYICAV